MPRSYPQQVLTTVINRQIAAGEPVIAGIPDRKGPILAALRAFVNQRPGLEFGNYGDWSAYRSELRGITRDRKEALELLRAIERHDSITADDILAASGRAYSGRLTIKESDGRVTIDYCTGQYWPTEYRCAVAAVAASALWDWTRDDCMPEPVYKKYGSATDHPMQTVALYNGLRAGDWLRRYFRREFGRGIQSRWFN